MSYMMRPVSFCLLLGACSCARHAPPPDQGEGQNEETGAAPDTGHGAPEEELTWTPLTEEGDPIGDCESGDPGCLADITALQLALDACTLHLELTFASDFPTTGSFEVFLLPTDVNVDGYSFRYLETGLLFWKTNCEVTRGPHAGCHWFEASEPESFAWEWTDTTRFRAQVARADFGLEDVTDMGVGVAAAPETISVTAEFSDRYPDELLNTEMEVEGLSFVQIEACLSLER